MALFMKITKESAGAPPSHPGSKGQIMTHAQIAELDKHNRTPLVFGIAG
jgi:hypothetical protein